MSSDVNDFILRSRPNLHMREQPQKGPPNKQQTTRGAHDDG